MEKMRRKIDKWVNVNKEIIQSDFGMEVGKEWIFNAFHTLGINVQQFKERITTIGFRSRKKNPKNKTKVKQHLGGLLS